MTVKQLKEFISDLPDDTPVLQRDASLQDDEMFPARPDLRWVLAIDKTDPEEGYVFDRAMPSYEPDVVTAVVF